MQLAMKRNRKEDRGGRGAKDGKKIYFKRRIYHRGGNAREIEVIMRREGSNSLRV